MKSESNALESDEDGGLIEMVPMSSTTSVDAKKYICVSVSTSVSK